MIEELLRFIYTNKVNDIAKIAKVRQTLDKISVYSVQITSLTPAASLFGPYISSALECFLDIRGGQSAHALSDCHID